MAEPADSAQIIPLGKRLKSHREEHGLSQAQAARELDVARTAYRLWEMEAAKPSPDRWRLIAGWLGVSVSTMLLGANLIDEQDAKAADRIAGSALQAGGEPWDDIASASAGDFFDQERSTIAQLTEGGTITSAESRRLTASLDRVMASVRSRAAVPPPGEFRKELVADTTAPQLARTALVVTAAGVPDDIVDRAELLTSELVTTSVERGGAGGSLMLAITLHADVLRVEVADAAIANEPTTTDDRARWSLAIIAALASRWGAGREADLNVAWFEIDLPEQATQTA